MEEIFHGEISRGLCVSQFAAMVEECWHDLREWTSRTSKVVSHLSADLLGDYTIFSENLIFFFSLS